MFGGSKDTVVLSSPASLPMVEDERIFVVSSIISNSSFISISSSIPNSLARFIAEGMLIRKRFSPLNFPLISWVAARCSLSKSKLFFQVIFKLFCRNDPDLRYLEGGKTVKDSRDTCRCAPVGYVHKFLQAVQFIFIEFYIPGHL